MIPHRRASTALLLAFLLLASAPALSARAQQQDSNVAQPDLVPVMIWTAVVAGIAMLVLGLGYLYRRARGAQDEVIPKTVDPYYAEEGLQEQRSTRELHPEMAHDGSGGHAIQPPTHAGAEQAVSNVTAPEPSLPIEEAKQYEAGAPTS